MNKKTVVCSTSFSLVYIQNRSLDGRSRSAGYYTPPRSSRSSLVTSFAYDASPSRLSCTDEILFGKLMYSSGFGATWNGYFNNPSRVLRTEAYNNCLERTAVLIRASEITNATDSDPKSNNPVHIGLMACLPHAVLSSRSA